MLINSSNIHEKKTQQKERFTLEEMVTESSSDKYNNIEYKRDFPKIVKEGSSHEDKLEYAVKQILLKSLEMEFTYKQLTEAIKKGDPQLYIDPNAIGRTVKKLGYVKKSRTRKGVRKYYYVFAPDTND